MIEVEQQWVRLPAIYARMRRKKFEDERVFLLVASRPALVCLLQVLRTIVEVVLATVGPHAG